MPSALPAAPSTLGSWAATILRALEARGVDAARLAVEAGIDPASLRPSTRVPRAALTRLWELAVEATGNPAFGLEASRFTAQTTFHALGYAVMASETLREAFGRMIRYQRFVGDILRLELVDDGERCRFRFDVSSRPGVPVQAVDAIAALCVRQARALHAPRPCEPLSVSFTRPEPVDMEPYRALFRAPLAFDAPCNEIVFPREDVDAPLPSASADLARANDEILVRALAAQEGARLSARVQRALMDALPTGPPSKRAIASALGFSPRNLQRGLEEEGTTFTALVEEARATLARGYLETGRLSVTEIAFMLGFADTSTFSRAFKRWTGRSPRDFAASRRRSAAAGSPGTRSGVALHADLVDTVPTPGPTGSDG